MKLLLSKINLQLLLVATFCALVFSMSASGVVHADNDVESSETGGGDSDGDTSSDTSAGDYNDDPGRTDASSQDNTSSSSQNSSSSSSSQGPSSTSRPSDNTSGSASGNTSGATNPSGSSSSNSNSGSTSSASSNRGTSGASNASSANNASQANTSSQEQDDSEEPSDNLESNATSNLAQNDEAADADIEFLSIKDSEFLDSSTLVWIFAGVIVGIVILVCAVAFCVDRFEKKRAQIMSLRNNENVRSGATYDDAEDLSEPMITSDIKSTNATKTAKVQKPAQVKKASRATATRTIQDVKVSKPVKKLASTATVRNRRQIGG